MHAVEILAESVTDQSGGDFLFFRQGTERKKGTKYVHLGYLLNKMSWMFSSKRSRREKAADENREDDRGKKEGDRVTAKQMQKKSNGKDRRHKEEKKPETL